MTRLTIPRRFLSTLAIASVGLLCLYTIGAWSQAISTGTVVGVITDQTNAVVPGATITLTDLTTHETRTTNTNDAGRFVFVNITPGTYDISVNKKGFAVAKVSAQAVKVGTQTTANIQLHLGEETQVVEVQATGTELQTMNATVGNTVTGIALQSLPSLGRDVSTFVTLQPGISPDGSVAGTVVDQSTFQLDGGNNTNDMDGSMSVYTPSYAGDPTGGISNQGFGVAAGPTGVMPTPADSVEEFKVNSANQTADFNSSSGAQVQVVTRRGTNTFHGSVYEYYLDNNFNANTWDNNHRGLKQPDYHYNRFGASIGGPLIPKEILGGKTYFFANYQGFRWPNSTTIERAVPSVAMRQGLLTFGGITYNLNPNTVNGIAPAQCPNGPCDPRALGVNSLVQKIWTQFMPLPNESKCSLSRCDQVNVQGFAANVSIPQNDNFGVFRVDHDFGSKWHFMSSYRYYKLTRATTSQVDIGGFFPNDKLGVPTALSNRPQVPWYYVAGLTTNISPSVTNDFHWSFLRNWWSWNTKEDPPQLPGLGAALEPFGETATQALIPYNVNTQQTRTRFWDGQDHMLRDDISMLKGNHLFQFGGTYQHNYNFHQRTDNGGGINYEPVYQLGTTSGAGITMDGFIPCCDAKGNFLVPVKNWGRDYAAVLGIVSVSQDAFTRTGANLALNPPHTPAFDQSTIPYYNVYFSDTWHMKPTFTLTYGLGWTLEMPPVEKNGKQVELVDASNQPIDTLAYLRSRERAALQGQVFNPQVGFALVGNTANGLKYPYNPFYGSFSPRLAAAWNPDFGDTFLGHLFGGKSTVFRAGYSRIYGRLNGVDLVLVPLLGTGLIQPVQCTAALSNGSCSSGSANPGTAFRIGKDGLIAPLPAASPTLPQPDFPGINDVAAGAGEALDPHFRPNVVDSFDVTIQRQLSRKVTLELGYIGRIINHEYQPININAVPYMMTLGGQSFAKAYAAIEKATNFGNNVPAVTTVNGLKTVAGITPQPFFEAAMQPSFCAGYSSCTAAVVANEAGNFASQTVWDLWSDLDKGGFNFPRSMMNTPINNAPCPGSTSTDPCGVSGQLTSGVGVNASVGYGNYHAGFATIRMSDWKGLTMQSNFTWSKALGTGAEVQATSEYTPDDPFNLGTTYGLQPFDRKFVYNMFIVYQPPFFKNQQGFMGRLLGGWTLAPIFAAGSGLPLEVSTVNGNSEAFGAGDALNFFDNENGVLLGPLTQGNSRHNNVSGSNGIGTSGFGVNMFKDPAAAFNLFRNPILGLDTKDGGFGVLRGLPYWNVDLSVRKDIKLTERFSAEAQVIFTNVLNHVQFGDPVSVSANTGSVNNNLDLSNPATFGVLPGQGNFPRQMEFGIRLKY